MLCNTKVRPNSPPGDGSGDGDAEGSVPGDGSKPSQHWSGYGTDGLVGRIHAAMVNGDEPTGRLAAIPSVCERQLCPSSWISARLVKTGVTESNGG